GGEGGGDQQRARCRAGRQAGGGGARALLGWGGGPPRGGGGVPPPPPGGGGGEGPCPRRVRPLPPRGLDGAEQAVLLVAHAGGEEQGVRGAALVTVAKRQPPEIGDRQRTALVVRERAGKGTAPGIGGVDLAVSCIAH